MSSWIPVKLVTPEPQQELLYRPIWLGTQTAESLGLGWLRGGESLGTDLTTGSGVWEGVWERFSPSPFLEMLEGGLGPRKRLEVYTGSLPPHIFLGLSPCEHQC